MPPRKRRNISGLKNQAPKHSPPPSPESGPAEVDESDDDNAQQDTRRTFGQRAFFRESFGLGCGDRDVDNELFVDFDESESDRESDTEEIEDEDLDSVDVKERLVKWANEHEDDPRDEDWVPQGKKQRPYIPIPRPKQYATGPDVARKSARSQRRYKKQMLKQRRLTEFKFSHSPSPAPSTVPQPNQQAAVSKPKDEPMEDTHTHATTHHKRLIDVLIRQETPDHIEIPPAIRQESVDIEIPPASRHESTDIEVPPAGDNDSSDEEDDTPDDRAEDVAAEIAHGGHLEIRPWDVLREQIKKDLEKGANTLPLSQLNKLMLLRNYATLRLKGNNSSDASIAIAQQWHEGAGTYFARRVRSLARHYQLFEQLPDENRGGMRKSTSLLTDERLQSAARSWLTAQKAGEVTPMSFRRALNGSILPSLNITPRKPIGDRTARRWLIRLGWRLSQIKKGVYMDGHEREDVVEYRNSVFLPAMERYQARMATWDEAEDGSFTRTPPVLKEGEKEIIPCFQDESCFAQNEYKSSAWLRDGQVVLQKKGRGRLVHVSEYINPETGRLVHIENGTIRDEARKIIYPGSNGDAWWDMDQMLAQAKHAIQVFEKQFPGRVGLFIYDQSSAHGSLGPDALRANTMNKGDGGKQRTQRDTVIPQSNPYPQFRGQIQKMTLPNGSPKGLETVLKERGFDTKGLLAKCSPACKSDSTANCCMVRILSRQDDFANQESMLEKIIREAGHLCIFLPKFHCELNPIEMYWGWAKYRYREVEKKTFAEAKDAARKYLDACPDTVIRRFINRSWRFMSAYRKGLTGRAAEWAVKKQPKHRVVTERAMMQIEAILN